jgi:hypothetical protein
METENCGFLICAAVRFIDDNKLTHGCTTVPITLQNLLASNVHPGSCMNKDSSLSSKMMSSDKLLSCLPCCFGEGKKICSAKTLLLT